MNIPVTPLALMCNCFNVLSLQSVLVGGGSPFWGIPVMCIYASGHILALLVHLCVFQQLLNLFGFC